MSRRDRAITLYLSVAFGLTWLVWLPYLWAARSGRPAPDPFLFYLAAGGPFVGAVVAEHYERRWPGVRDILRRLIDWRRTGWWVIVGVGSPLLLIPRALVPGYLATGTWPAWDGISVRRPALPASDLWRAGCS